MLAMVICFARKEIEAEEIDSTSSQGKGLAVIVPLRNKLINWAIISSLLWLASFSCTWTNG